jgi:carboxypeptidase C (cathepsin A)
MTGGPGCSSGIALFNENGPCSVKMSGMSTKKNAFSWNSKANMLFIDQPAGTGFSFGEAESDYDHNEAGVSRDMYNFLQAFYAAHPEYKPNPFHVFGESYGGHFVPATAGAILAGNKVAVNEGKFVIPLKGVGIGNGLTAPEIQYGFYGKYAAESPVGPLVPSVVSLAMRASSVVCVKEIAACQENPDTYVPSPEVAAVVAAARNRNQSGGATREAVSALLGSGHRSAKVVAGASAEDACDSGLAEHHMYVNITLD